MSALHRKLGRELWQLRGQIAAIALVLAGGIGTVVMAVSNVEALSDTRARFYAEHRFADVFATARRAPRPLLDAIAALPGVDAVEGRASVLVTLVLDDFPDPVSAQIVSLPPAGETALNSLFLRRGRLPLADDEVVVGEAFAEAHGFRPDDRLVALLNGRRQALTIVGIGLSPEFVYPIRPGDIFPDFARFAVLWMPRGPLARAFDLDGAFNSVVLSLARDAREAEVIDGLDALLAPYGGSGAHGRDLQMSHRFLDEELGQLRVMTRLFGALFLGVATFLLHVVVGRIVQTQREQIALLKAFGYRRLEIARHYGELALAMVAVGVVPGLALGAWLGHGLGQIYMAFYRFPYLDWTLSPALLGIAALFALATAALGASSALARVYRLPPAEAMRPEPPPRYRRSLAERAGLAFLLDPPARMVLRNLERRPLRATLSVLGIGLGCGILVMAGFQRAAIESMIDLQFGFAQRDDFAVTLTEPSGRAVADELAALPGVIAVEPHRFAAARLWHGHRSYRSALQGIEANGDLKHVLDADLAPVAIPAEGLLLSDWLAAHLDVRPGGWLDVELLEGQRRRLRLPVAGVIHDYLGVAVHAERRWLNRQLGEGDAISGAWLDVDPASRESVLGALRARPRVAAVGDRAGMIASFRTTMAEGILTFTLVATLMAGAIALGVVYNAARIALAERGRELASLRVLGYTRGEVRALLSGELGLLAVLALPLGFVLGYGMCGLLVHGFQSDLYRIPLVVAPAGYALAGLTVLAATALSVMLVRRRVDRLDLVDVLKTRE